MGVQEGSIDILITMVQCCTTSRRMVRSGSAGQCRAVQGIICITVITHEVQNSLELLLICIPLKDTHFLHVTSVLASDYTAD